MMFWPFANLCLCVWSCYVCSKFLFDDLITLLIAMIAIDYYYRDQIIKQKWQLTCIQRFVNACICKQTFYIIKTNWFYWLHLSGQYELSSLNRMKYSLSELRSNQNFKMSLGYAIFFFPPNCLLIWYCLKSKFRIQVIFCRSEAVCVWPLTRECKFCTY